MLIVPLPFVVKLRLTLASTESLDGPMLTADPLGAPLAAMLLPAPPVADKYCVSPQLLAVVDSLCIIRQPPTPGGMTGVEVCVLTVALNEPAFDRSTGFLVGQSM
jgi:hypothetical protein